MKLVKLKSTIRPSGENEENDLLQVKDVFRETGYYQETPYAGQLNPKLMDIQLEEGIKSFQKDNQLNEDGILTPDGETVQALNRLYDDMERRRNTFRVRKPLSEATRVFDYDAEDLLNTKFRLEAKGYYQFPDYVSKKHRAAFPDREMFKSIKKFQQDHGLTVDGIINPGGETEKALQLSENPGILPQKDINGGKHMVHPSQRALELAESSETFLKASPASVPAEPGEKEQGTALSRFDAFFQKPASLPAREKAADWGKEREEMSLFRFDASLTKPFSLPAKRKLTVSDKKEQGTPLSRFDAFFQKLASLPAREKAAVSGEKESTSERRAQFPRTSDKASLPLFRRDTQEKNEQKDNPPMTNPSPESEKEKKERDVKTIQQFRTEYPNQATLKETVYRDTVPDAYNEIVDFMMDHIKRFEDEGLFQWAKNSQTDGIHDFKPMLKGELSRGFQIDETPLANTRKGRAVSFTIRFPGDDEYVYDHDIWGNIYYGYKGSSFNWSDRTLKTISEVLDHFSTEDEEAVKIGIELWKLYGKDMTKKQFSEYILQNRHRLERNRIKIK